MGDFERRIGSERMAYILACASIIADSGMSDDFNDRADAVGALFLDVMEICFNKSEQVVFVSMFCQFLEETLQEASDEAWSRFAESVIEQEIGDE